MKGHICSDHKQQNRRSVYLRLRIALPMNAHKKSPASQVMQDSRKGVEPA